MVSIVVGAIAGICISEQPKSAWAAIEFGPAALGGSGDSSGISLAADSSEKSGNKLGLDKPKNSGRKKFDTFSNGYGGGGGGAK